MTEFLEGYSPLIEHIKYIADNDEQCIHISSQLCEGLFYLHNNGVAHRDIKPANIMVHMDTMQVKYIDFGMSCITKDQIGHGCTHKIVGTPNYLDPLVVFHRNYKNKIDMQKADLWSLGILLFVIQSKGLPPAQIIKGKLSSDQLFDENDDLMQLFEFNITAPIDEIIGHKKNKKINSIFTKHKQLYDRATQLGMYYGYIPHLLSKRREATPKGNSLSFASLIPRSRFI